MKSGVLQAWNQTLKLAPRSVMSGLWTQVLRPPGVRRVNEAGGWVRRAPSTEVFWGVYIEVSKNGGTQQPWVFLLKIIILGCFGGTTISGNIHI